MNKLFDLIESEDQNIACAAWKFTNRLPIYTDLKRDLNIKRKYALKYWLYLQEASQKANEIDQETLKMVLHSEIETVCIGLKVCEERSDFTK